MIRTPTGLANFTFNARNVAAERDLRENSSSLIGRLTEEARENVRSELEEGLLRGDNPRTTALNIVGRINPRTQQREGGVIGLTNAQQQTVTRAEQRLRGLDKSYFTLTLRDKRFDSVVQKAIDTGENLSETDIRRILTSYKNRALKSRADTISRTETIQSIERAAFRAHLQLIEDGLVERSAITKEWDDVGDGVTRTTHAELGDRYGRNNGIDLEAPFVSVSGDRLNHPGDSTLGAEAGEIINCRCRARYRVDFLANVE